MTLPEWFNKSFGTRTKGMAILLLLLFTILSVAMSGHFSAKPVLMIVDGEEQTLETSAKTVNQVLSESGIYLRKQDVLLPDGETAVESGMTIYLQRAAPVFVQVDGKERLVYSAAQTAAEVLEEADVQLALEDRVEPGLNAKLHRGEKIIVTRVNTELVTEEETIPYQTKSKADDTLPRGRRRVEAEGKPGTLLKTFKVTYADGAEESRELIEEKRASEPVHAVILLGTAEEEPIITASRVGRATGEVIEGIASWYGDKFHGNKTAYGDIYDKNKLTAAYPSRSMRGRTLRVTYLKTGRSVDVVVNDYGPHIPGRIIDLSKAAAASIGLISDGVGKVRVEVLE